jgi:hypothetical protein
VGNYAITRGTVSAGSNYAVTFVNGQLTITPRPITVTANDLTRLFSSNDPPLTFAVTSGNLVNGNSLSGALTRDAGDAPGAYTIRQGSLTAGSDYRLTFVNGTLVIQALPASALPVSAPSPSLVPPASPPTPTPPSTDPTGFLGGSDAAPVAPGQNPNPERANSGQGYTPPGGACRVAARGVCVTP